MSSTKEKDKKNERRISKFFETPKSLILSLPSSQLVPHLRERFLKLYLDNPHLYDEHDINKVKNDTWTVQRFIESWEDPDKALQHMDNAMKWRKSFGVNRRTFEKNSPREFFLLGAFFIYNEDKEGNKMVKNSFITSLIYKFKHLIIIFDIK